MFDIDKEKFGAFVAQLRKEKGYTQKELARRLYISDKAVSKWETGASIPDTALLMPLAEALGVTVTELLLCRRMEQGQAVEPGQVETAVKTAITYSGVTSRGRPLRSRWGLLYFLSLAVGLIFLALDLTLKGEPDMAVTMVILGGIFGAYFCFWAPRELPRYYDDNIIHGMMDGPLRMNIPGLRFHNGNWPHIVNVCRIWSCAALAGYPLLFWGMNLFFPALWQFAGLGISLTLVLGGLFVPVYYVGKKYE